MIEMSQSGMRWADNVQDNAPQPPARKLQQPNSAQRGQVRTQTGPAGAALLSRVMNWSNRPLQTFKSNSRPAPTKSDYKDAAVSNRIRNAVAARYQPQKTQTQTQTQKGGKRQKPKHKPKLTPKTAAKKKHPRK